MDAFDRVMGGSGFAPASKGKRILSDLFDLIFIPIVIGVVAGIALLNVGEAVRAGIMILLNVAWLVFRDAYFSPGRALTGLKIVSDTGARVTVVQALIRNVLLIVPVVLVIGYVIEIISVFSKGNRLADGWAKTHVVAA